MDKISCPDCNSKLRKFKGGVICVKNHKFVEGTELHDIYYGTNIYNNKMLCPNVNRLGLSFLLMKIVYNVKMAINGESTRILFITCQYFFYSCTSKKNEIHAQHITQTFRNKLLRWI